ncbi:MAG: type IV secretory system conjugative DNA transfer family protein [Candidatus Binataceae bacterium]
MNISKACGEFTTLGDSTTEGFGSSSGWDRSSGSTHRSTSQQLIARRLIKPEEVLQGMRYDEKIVQAMWTGVNAKLNGGLADACRELVASGRTAAMQLVCEAYFEHQWHVLRPDAARFVEPRDNRSSPGDMRQLAIASRVRSTSAPCRRSKNTKSSTYCEDLAPPLSFNALHEEGCRRRNSLPVLHSIMNSSVHRWARRVRP